MRSASNEVHEMQGAAADAVLLIDGDGRVTAVNREAEVFFGWTERELVGEPIGQLVPSRFQWLVDANYGAAVESSAISMKGGTVNCFARRRDGSEFPVQLARRAVGSGVDAVSVVSLRDITEWRRAEDTRLRNNELARLTLASIGDSVITADTAGRVVYLNAMAEKLTGWTEAEACGQALEAVLPLISEASRQPIENLVARCLEEGRSIDLEDGVVLLRRDGTELPVGDSTAPVTDRLGNVIGVVLVIQDESEKRRIGHRLSFEASHDALTGLINRREFERRLAGVLANLPDNGSENVILCLDLDRFKAINDACGHDAGDAVLRGFATLVSGHLRKRDSLARLGGDEFGVLLESCPLSEAERIAENLRSGVEEYRFEWGGRSFAMGVSIGMVPITPMSGGIATVRQAVDAACYRAKEGGGNRVHIEPFGRDTADIPIAMERRVAHLSHAVEEGQFQLYAQPIVALRSNAAARPRFEVLLRLPDGEGQIEPAAKFLPQAERYSLMPAIDRWVVETTVALLGGWRQDNPGAQLPACSINLSASALTDDDFVPILERQLAKFGIPPDTICFEVTEAAALADLSRTIRFLAGLRATGCGMALEDFGSGVTSFTYLKALPVDFLKIGGHFVRDIVEDPMYGSIVSAIDHIGRSMGIRTVAKQVDSQRALRKLRALGIGYAQGHALNPPVPMTGPDGRLVLPH